MAASTGGLKVPSPTSSSSRSSLALSQSIRSQRSQRSQIQSTNRTVVTSPPWALDEPPSPLDDPNDNATFRQQSDCRRSDVGSTRSSIPPGSVHESRWWTFTRPQAAEPSQYAKIGERSTSVTEKSEKKGRSFRDRSMSWLPATHRRPESSPQPKGSKGHQSATEEHQNDWGLTIDLSTPPTALFTMAHSRTPGWDTPWTARPEHDDQAQASDEDDREKLSPWAARSKRLRVFILTNNYVPLLFRVVNITFTTAALAVAIRIRIFELHNHVMGAVGSSPTLVIIFAPLTLVHVMVAIYLEYFGRPLGLWHISSKLTYTLTEVLFICAWSAAFSLCFDNYFTSLVPCAPASSTAWYNEIPRPADPNLGRYTGGVGDRICDSQLVLIVLVGLGLIMYCMNLFISLFRIFQKVKHHPGARLNMA